MGNALTNAFSEWNRMLIDQQQWNVEHEKIRADKQNQHMLNVERAKDMAIQREQTQLGIQAQRQQNILQGQKVKELEEYMKPRQVNIYDHMPRTFVDDPEYVESVKDVFRDIDPGVKFSVADGMVVGSTGQPLMMDGPTLEQRIPFLSDVRRGYTDGPAQWKQAYATILPQYEAALKTHKKYKGMARADAQAKRIKAWDDIKRLEPQVNELRQNLSDDGVQSYYDNNAAYFDSKASWAASRGMKKAEEFYRSRGNDFRSRGDAYFKGSVGTGQKATYKAIYDTDQNSPTYGHAVDFYKGTIMGMPELGPNRAYEKPPALTSEKKGFDDIKPDAVLNNIEQVYTTAQRGAVIQDPLLADKQATHTGVARALMELTDENGNRAYSNMEAQTASQEFMKQISDTYFDRILSYKGKTPKMIQDEVNKMVRPQDNPKWKDLPKEEQVLRAQKSKLFKRWLEDNNVTLTASNINRVMGDWELFFWKKEVEATTGIPASTVYTPSKYTRSQKMRMERMGAKIFNKQRDKDDN